VLLPVALLLGLAAARGWGGRRQDGGEGGGIRAGCGGAADPGRASLADWPRWFLLALGCLYSHVILDLSNSWGTLPFLPFSSRRVSLDAASIVDVFIFSLTLASFVLNRWLRRERVEVFANPLAYPVRHRHPGRARLARRLARPAAILSVLYLAAGWLQGRQVADLARRELAKSGVEVAEARAMPLPFTWLAWAIAVRDSGGTVYNALYSSFSPAPLRFSSQAAVSGPAAERALASPDGEKFVRFSQGMYSVRLLEVASGQEAGPSGQAGQDRRPGGVSVRLPAREIVQETIREAAREAAAPSGARTRVELRDRRFFSLAPPWRPQFGLDIFLDADLGILAAWDWRSGPFPGGLGDELARLRRLILDGRADPSAP
ncbi:MAG: metal-dependent hydrolase, partial [Planctomycetota bacterium]|jgi:hypothetical protein|nr:metal-dependent hydrolase [Planctomycetota bacterium]